MPDITAIFASAKIKSRHRFPVDGAIFLALAKCAARRKRTISSLFGVPQGNDALSVAILSVMPFHDAPTGVQ